jgi:hypothetical protein
MCCLAVSQLLVLGKSVISAADKSKNEDGDDVKIEWPEDLISKAEIIRWRAESIAGDIEKVSTSFATGKQKYWYSLSALECWAWKLSTKREHIALYL